MSSPADAAYGAFLWLCMWRPEFTFIHIPKTAGTSIEGDDLGSPYQKLMLLRQGGANVSRARSAFGSFSAGRWPTLNTSEGSSTSWCTSFGRHRPWCAADAASGTVSAQRCVTFATYTFHAHVSPEQARLCGVDSAWAFYPRPTYCVVRDPFSRFLSLFIFVQYHAHIWPARRCGRAPVIGDIYNPRGHWLANVTSPSDIAQRANEQLQCLADECEKAIRLFETQRDGFAAFEALVQAAATSHGGGGGGGGGGLRVSASVYPPVLVFHELLHMCLPQAMYVSDSAGQPTCDLPFAYDDLRHAGAMGMGHDFPRGAYGTSRWIGAWSNALSTNDTLRRRVGAIYRADVELYERVKSHTVGATDRHTPLATQLRTLRQAHPWLQVVTPEQPLPTCGLEPSPSRSKQPPAQGQKLKQKQQQQHNHEEVASHLNCTHAACCGRGAAAFADLLGPDLAKARQARPTTAFGAPVGGTQALRRRCTSCILEHLEGPRARARIVADDGNAREAFDRRSS